MLHSRISSLSTSRRIVVAAVVAIVALSLIPVAAAAAPGQEIGSIPTPGHCPQGLTFDGKHLWNVDRKSDQIYCVDPTDGHMIDSIPTPGYIPRGLTWDGSRLWTVDAEEELLYAINPDTRIVERTIYCPVSNPTGLAWNGTYLWIANDRGEELNLISPEDGTTISSIPSPTSHSWGLTFDGTYLWVSDRYKDRIFMVEPERGDVVITFDSPGPHSCGLAWDGTNLWNADYQTDRIHKLVARDDAKFVRLESRSQECEFIHQVRNFGPDSVKTLDIYLALPHARDNQEMAGDLEYTPAPTDVLTDKWGQQVAHFRYTDLAASDFVQVSMTARAHLYQVRYFVFPDRIGTLKDIPKEIADKYLADDVKFDLSNEIIQDGLKKALGDETNPYWIARKIYNYLIENMYYELAGGWNVAPAVLERGNGSCSEYSFVYIAMCRAAGIPARYAGAITVRSDDASYDDVFHRWVEVYLPGFGWLPVDPSGGDSKWPSDRADSFGFINNRYLITTVGGGGSEYLEWGYNANQTWTSKGRCKVGVEYLGEWSPLVEEGEE